jgi:hypothetical protein
MVVVGPDELVKDSCQTNKAQEKYWLCCGSHNPKHSDKSCHEAASGYPQYVRYGTAEEHRKYLRNLYG